MTSCKHDKLTLLPENKKRLQCKHCHLTIKTDELDNSYCPECFEIHGKRRYDFIEIKDDDTEIKYRCEKCHIIVKCK